jgi:hypothetical protein
MAARRDSCYNVVQVAQPTLPGSSSPAVPAVCPQACVSADAQNASASLYLSYSERQSLPDIQDKEHVCEEYNLRSQYNRGAGDCFYLSLQQCLKAIKHKDALDSVDTMRTKICDALIKAFMDQKTGLVQRHDFLMRCSDNFKFDTNKICENAGLRTQRFLVIGQLEVFSDYCAHHLRRGTWATNEQLLAVPKVYGVCLRVFQQEENRECAVQNFSPLTPGNEKDESCERISMFCNDFHYEALIPDEGSYSPKPDQFRDTLERKRSDSRAEQYIVNPRRKRDRIATYDHDSSQNEVERQKMLIRELEDFIRMTKADDMNIDVDWRHKTLVECDEMLKELRGVLEVYHRRLNIT